MDSRFATVRRADSQAGIARQSGTSSAKSAPRSAFGSAQLREAVCQFYEIGPADLALSGSRHPARMVFAGLARSYTTATFVQLSQELGLSRRDSVPSLLRRLKGAPADVQQQLSLIRLQLGL